jgi:phosphomannomutase
MTIHFGTDGWRAVMSDTFTFTNLRLVAQAIADAVASPEWINGTTLEVKPDPRKMVVGFDTRFLSDRYATEVARVLAGNGFTVLLAQADAPTPVISHAVLANNAIGGVMITASHNAPRYNGVKLKSASGGSALPEQCRRVEIYLNDNEERGRGPNLMDVDQARELKLIQRFNPIPAYYEHLRKLIDCDIIAENPQRFVIDSMYGSGRGVIRGFLQGSGCEISEIRGEMNPGFGGCTLNRSAITWVRWRGRSAQVWAISVSPPTATPTASARWTSAATSSIPTRSCRWRCATWWKNAA